MDAVIAAFNRVCSETPVGRAEHTCSVLPMTDPSESRFSAVEFLHAGERPGDNLSPGLCR